MDEHSNPAWRVRFNFDGAGNGFSIDPDEFYLNWPRKSSPRAVALYGWLKNLTPRQELALFMLSRGHVLAMVAKDDSGAQIAYAHAARLWPTNRAPLVFLAHTAEKFAQKQLALHPAFDDKVVRKPTRGVLVHRNDAVKINKAAGY